MRWSRLALSALLGLAAWSCGLSLQGTAGGPDDGGTGQLCVATGCTACGGNQQYCCPVAQQKCAQGCTCSTNNVCFGC